MGRFVVDKHLHDATSTLKLLAVPFQDNRLHKDASQIDIGFTADTTLKQLRSSKQVSERQAIEVRLDCKRLLIALEKLLKKAPLQHTLVRSMQCLDPRRMAKSKEQCVKQMTRMLHILVECKHIDDAVCDDTLREFSLEFRFATWLVVTLRSGSLIPTQIELTAFSTRQWGVSHLFAECGI